MEIKRPWLLFFGLALGPFMVGIDLLAIAVAIDPMTKSLHINISTLQWLLTAYAIGNSSFLVAAGKLADFYGKKIVFIFGLTIFALASLSIALLSSPFLIILFRLLQGASGGILPVVGIATITAIFPPDKRGPWTAGIVGAAGLGMVLGPAIGGYLIHHFGWRMIFLLNVPVGLFAILLVLLYMPKLPLTARPEEKIDWLGVIFLIGVLALFSIGMSEGHFWGWSSFKTISVFIATLLLLLILLGIEKRIKDPLINFKLFKAKNFLLPSLAGSILYFALTAWILVFGIYLERVDNLTPQEAGLTFIPFGILLALIAPFFGIIKRFFSDKLLCCLGLYFCGIAFLGMALIPLIPTFWFLSPLFALFGLGFILVNSTSITLSLEFIPKDQAGIASGKNMMMRWLGGAIGSALISTLFISHSYSRLQSLSQGSNEDYLHGILTGQIPFSDLTTHFHGATLTSARNMIDHAYHHGLVISMYVIAALFFITALFCTLFITKTPSQSKNS